MEIKFNHSDYAVNNMEELVQHVLGHSIEELTTYSTTTEDVEPARACAIVMLLGKLGVEKCIPMATTIELLTGEDCSSLSRFAEYIFKAMDAGTTTKWLMALDPGASQAEKIQELAALMKLARIAAGDDPKRNAELDELFKDIPEELMDVLGKE